MSQSDTQPWWRGAVIYQVYPRSFLDSNGDGVGDLPGISAGLDYIKGLGVDALWISPFFKSPMKDFGYDVADYRTVDPLYGSNADFEALVAAAHERDLRVVIDLVLPHSSAQHPWFQESRRSRDNGKADWYVWADAKRDGTPPNNWLAVFGGPAWSWDAQRCQYYYHHFLEEQPNLNWNNPEVVAAMLDVIRFWLDRGVDGLRLDAISTLVCDPDLRDNPPVGRYSPAADIAGTKANPFTHQEHMFECDQPHLPGLFTRLRRLTDSYPGAFMLGEIADVDSIDATARYTQGRDRLHTGYTFQFTQPEFGVDRLQHVIGRMEREIGDGWPTWAFSNHDCIRVATRWGSLPGLDGKRDALARQLLALLLSLRGSLCLYQGEELGLPEADIPYEQMVDPWGVRFYPTFKGRDGCRTPMPWRHDRPHGGFTEGAPWLPVPEEHLVLAVDRQEANPDSVLQTCRLLLRWRKAHPALVTGSLALLDTTAPIFAIERAEGGERILCVFNLSNAPAQFAAAGDWQPLDGHGCAAAAFDGRTVSLPPFGVFFAGRRDE